MVRPRDHELAVADLEIEILHGRGNRRTTLLNVVENVTVAMAKPSAPSGSQARGPCIQPPEANVDGPRTRAARGSSRIVRRRPVPRRKGQGRILPQTVSMESTEGAWLGGAGSWPSPSWCPAASCLGASPSASQSKIDQSRAVQNRERFSPSRASRPGHRMARHFRETSVSEVGNGLADRDRFSRALYPGGKRRLGPSPGPSC